MALTELQLPTKAEFYRVIQSIASDIDNCMRRWEAVAEFVARMDTADLDAMSVAAGVVRTDLVDFRIALNNLVSLYNGNSVTPAKNPSTVIDSLRRIA
jgi:hypothetical protein